MCVYFVALFIASFLMETANILDDVTTLYFMLVYPRIEPVLSDCREKMKKLLVTNKKLLKCMFM